ncbi:phage replisome organizer N-terminal domain-containing protein [Clostridium sp.]|uniref:phage replisome organizer N-terminal domain-containing protein n=2 Tax=unclassified Clostridium TaxID=2614128 RepID=UPI0026376A7C|nr:phage replisome organizer N-terminal domain-containing protein [Clostridium sp.]
MRERKCVKINVNMYDDTKFKIIDRMEKRDLINYVWIRLVVLAGKVNLEGELFLSRNIPYTIETLAVEFNREVSEIELAIKAFIDLEMVEVTQDKIYKVKNFTKHQNIKTSKKAQNQDNVEEVENNKEKINGKQIVNDSNKNIGENVDKILESSDTKSETIAIENNEKEKLYEGSDNKHNENKVIDINTTNTKNAAAQNLNTEKLKNEGDSPDDILTPLSNEKVKNKSKPRKKEIINEISVTDENEEIIGFSEGAPPIGKDDKVLYTFSF